MRLKTVWMILTLSCVSVQAAEMTIINEGGFRVVEHPDRLVISLDSQPVTEFVFKDEKIRRPYFSQVRTVTGKQVTRQHPPVQGTDATDHDTMHPGIWLAFGDINGQDFWRNKASIEHLQFTKQPVIEQGRLKFATESQLTVEGNSTSPLARLLCSFEIRSINQNWLLVWTAEFHPGTGGLVFGDQEEMGFGTRVATAITEKNGGQILNSSGQATAAITWGKPADWCDYSGVIDGQPVGITVFSSPTNFRQCWWHNRDYGLMVANPFGRASMKQGEPSAVSVSHGESIKLTFAAFIHEGVPYTPPNVYLKLVVPRQD